MSSHLYTFPHKSTYLFTCLHNSICLDSLVQTQWETLGPIDQTPGIPGSDKNRRCLSKEPKEKKHNKEVQRIIHVNTHIKHGKDGIEKEKDYNKEGRGMVQRIIWHKDGAWFRPSWASLLHQPRWKLSLKLLNSISYCNVNQILRWRPKYYKVDQMRAQTATHPENCFCI